MWIRTSNGIFESAGLYYAASDRPGGALVDLISIDRSGETVVVRRAIEEDEAKWLLDCAIDAIYHGGNGPVDVRGADKAGAAAG